MVRDPQATRQVCGSLVSWTFVRLVVFPYRNIVEGPYPRSLPHDDRVPVFVAVWVQAFASLGAKHFWSLLLTLQSFCAACLGHNLDPKGTANNGPTPLKGARRIMSLHALSPGKTMLQEMFIPVGMSAFESSALRASWPAPERTRHLSSMAKEASRTYMGPQQKIHEPY